MLHWDLWLGPAPERPYNPDYVPANWRRWWDFGGGNMGDMACHHMDLPFWALDLRYPTRSRPKGRRSIPNAVPAGLIVHYEFPARGDQPAGQAHLVRRRPRFHRRFMAQACGGGGNLFVGDKGMLWADYGNYRLLPESDFAGYKPPEPTIPRSIGHHAEWIAACKTGSPTTCNFDYSGALTEAVLLGVAWPIAPARKSNGIPWR